MRQQRILVYGLALAAAVCFSAASAQAHQEVIDAPVSLTSAKLVTSAGDPSCCAPCAKCSKRCITYKHHPTLFKTCPCSCKTKKVVVQVYDPCCCCCIDVTVCIPDCCSDCVTSRSRGGLINRSVTNFRWSNGYRARIVVGPAGNVVVHTYGR